MRDLETAVGMAAAVVAGEVSPVELVQRALSRVQVWQDPTNAFTQLLSNVASDGTVEHVIYFLPPEISTIPGVAELRPLVTQACQQSAAVPCHFLDLNRLWTGHPEYTGAGAFLPTDAGAVVLGDAIWALMQQNCVAQ